MIRHSDHAPVEPPLYQLTRVPNCIVRADVGSPACQFASVVLPMPTAGTHVTRLNTLNTSRLNS